MDRVWTFTNCAAWSGWLYVLERLKETPLSTPLLELPLMAQVVLALEVVCCVEVGRMIVGDLRGSAATGVVLHSIRMVVILLVFPTASEVMVRTILLAWSVTELCRYPCYVFKESTLLKRVREAVPVVTFPLGAGTEALASCLARSAAETMGTRALLGVQICANVLGSTYAYPRMVARGKRAVFPPTPKVVSGVQFPRDDAGDRSTTKFAVKLWAGLADSLGAPGVAASIRREANWRAHYGAHVKRVAAAAAAADGEACVHAFETALLDIEEAFDFVRGGEATAGLKHAFAAYDEPALETVIIQGRGRLAEEVKVPWRGTDLGGEALDARLRAMEETGELSPDARETLTTLDRTLDLHGKCFVVFGASSEVGPAKVLLSRGATVLAVARRNATKWAKLIDFARTTPGTLYVPVKLGSNPRGDLDVAVNAGADLLEDAPELKTWLKEAVFAPLTIGVYTYLDGARHVAVNVACDAITTALISETRAGLTAGLAFLGSPGTVHLRPDAARVAASKKRLPPWQKLLVAAGVLKRQDDGRLYDGLLNLQGPNYALAKHMHMWRAAVARHQDHVVSCPMAPAVRTRSMVKVPAVASALRGGPYFGTHSYDPAFTSAIMALLLIAHVTDPKSRHAAPVPAHVPDKPMEAFALDGFTGGLWTSPFTPDSTAKPAALLGALAPFKFD